MSETAIRDYTNRDYASLLASLLDHAALRIPEWTDRSANDLGRLILETTALAGDVTLYYLDRLAAEAFPSTAVERRSVIDLLGLIGYSLSTPAPASATLTLTVTNDDVTPVVVSPGARFATRAAPGRPAVEFLYLPVDGSPLTVARTGAGGDLSFPLDVLNAKQIAGEIAGRTSGDGNQGFLLRQTPALLPRDPDSQDFIQVEIDPGTGFERWERRGTLLYSLSGDRHYTTRVRATDEVEIVIGDGSYGMVPPPRSEVRVTYLTGGGSPGNVGPGTITEVKSGVNVTARCRNELGASGGADRETIEHASALAPLVWRSLQRVVTATDWAALAQSVEGVARAFALAPSWNHVDLYVVAAGAQAPTPDLQARLLRFFETRRPVTTLLSVRAPVFVSVNVTVAIGVEPSFYQQDVAARARAAIEELFRIEALDFGQSIYVSKVFEAAEQVAGVAFAQVLAFGGVRSTRPPQSVSSVNGLLQLADQEFPRLGSLTITLQGGLP